MPKSLSLERVEGTDFPDLKMLVKTGTPIEVKQRIQQSKEASGNSLGQRHNNKAHRSLRELGAFSG